MKINSNEAKERLGKFAANPGTYQFGLSPKGFLLVNHGKTFEVADFKLYYGGGYFRRNGFEFCTNMTLPDAGMYLCSICNTKFISKDSEERFEFATLKKPLTDEFFLVLSMRFGGKIVLFIADGKFSKEVFLITLADISSNEAFSDALISNLVNVHNPEAAAMLINKEESNYGEE